MLSDTRLLKKDLFGEVWLDTSAREPVIVRNAGAARAWLRWPARALMRREARVLAALDGIDGVPQLSKMTQNELHRTYIEGRPMHRAGPREPRYFDAASRLLRHLHRAGVVHNDLAKEPNLLVTKDGLPAFIDFQLAWYSPRRGRLFRALALEDLRHLLKHKRTYCEHRLTARERRILANPSWFSRAWMRSVKPVYLFVTRRLFGWADREGAADRGDRSG